MVQSVIFCIFILSALEVSANNTTNLCNSFSTCGECIRSPYCAWCSEEGADNAPRCFKPNLHLPYIAELCSEDQVYFPAGTISWDDSSTGQLSPQIINLQLRVNEPLYFVIHFDKAANDTDISIVLNDNSSPYLSVEYISKCLGSYVETNVYCTNSIVLEASRHLHFNVKVELTKCPNGYKERYQKFQIFSENSTKSVDVNVETFCTCPCENPGFLGYQLKAKQCNNVGTLKCGVCECDLAHTGKYCECSVSELTELGCKANNSTDDVDCSGRGTCVCNTCECEITSNIRKKIWGAFCECDNFSCDRHNGKMCAGNGICTCGQCSCDSGYSGNACECTNSTTPCYPPFKKDALMCNGHGECICGRCECDAMEDGKFYGKFCENHPRRANTCKNLATCVLCQVYLQGPYNSTECAEKCPFAITVVDQLKVGATDKDFLCTGQDENGCAHVFKYQNNTNVFNITAQKDVQCV